MIRLACATLCLTVAGGPVAAQADVKSEPWRVTAPLTEGGQIGESSTGDDGGFLSSQVWSGELADSILAPFRGEVWGEEAAVLSPNTFNAAVEPIAGPLARVPFGTVLEGFDPSIGSVTRVFVPPIGNTETDLGDELLSVANRAENLDLVEACRRLVAAFVSAQAVDSCAADVTDVAVALTDGRFYVSVQHAPGVDYPLVQVLMIAQSSRMSANSVEGFERVAFEVYWSFNSAGDVYVDTVMVRALSYQGGGGGPKAFDSLLRRSEDVDATDLIRKDAMAISELGNRVENVFEALTID